MRTRDDPAEDGSQVSAAPPRRRVRRIVLAVVVAILALLVWGGAAALAAVEAYQDLSASRSAFRATAQHLRAADLSSARADLTAGVAASTRASDRLEAWYVRPLGHLPSVGPNLTATTALATGARDGGGSALQLLDAAAVIVHDDREQPPGTVSLDYLAELGPPLRDVADTLVRVTTELQAVDGSQLAGRVEAARTEFLDLVGPHLDAAVAAADLMEVAPALLGADEPRTYLVVAASLSELRSSGGLLGSWSTVTVDDGALAFDEFNDHDVFEPVQVAAPSGEHAQRYGQHGGLHIWRNANLTPDFPSAASVMLGHWEALGQPPADGVVLVDPVAFARLVERSGSVEVPGVTTLTPQDALSFVALDAYAVFDDDVERKRVLGATAAALFAEVFEILEDDDVLASATMFASMASGGHIRVYATDPSVQPVLERVGVGGELPWTAGESPGVFANNVAGNKVDWFVRRTIEHDVTVLEDGALRSTISTTFANAAPADGYPRHVLGPWADGLEAGDVRYLLHVLCSTTCVFDELPDDAVDGGTEHGRPVADLWVDVPAGASRTVDVTTTSQHGWSEHDGRAILEVEHLAQPTLHGSELRLRVVVPAGWTPISLPDGVRFADDVVELSTTASGVLRTHLEFDTGGGP